MCCQWLPLVADSGCASIRSELLTKAAPPTRVPLTDRGLPRPSSLPLLANTAVFGIGNLAGVGRDGRNTRDNVPGEFNSSSHIATLARGKEQTDMRIVEDNDPQEGTEEGWLGFVGTFD